MSNRMVKLARRPTGMITREDFMIEDGPIPQPGANELRVRVEYVSLDPAMRGWVNEGRSYVPPVGIGEVMRSLFGRDRRGIEQSPVQARRRRDGNVRRAALRHLQRRPRNARSTPARRRCSAGSAASACPAGPPTSACSTSASPRPARRWWCRQQRARSARWSGQIAKIKGCRAVGIAGGADKCRYVTDELGFDACVDYKAGNLAAQLKAAVPQGHRRQLRERRRRDLRHGADADEPVRPRRRVRPDLRPTTPRRRPQGPKNMRAVLTQRLRVQGLIVFDWAIPLSRGHRPARPVAQGGQAQDPRGRARGRARCLPRRAQPALHRRQHRQAGAEGVGTRLHAAPAEAHSCVAAHLDCQCGGVV